MRMTAISTGYAYGAYQRRLRVNRIAELSGDACGHAETSHRHLLPTAAFATHFAANDNMQVIVIQPDAIPHSLDEIEPPKVELSSLALAQMLEERDLDETPNATMLAPEGEGGETLVNNETEISELRQNRDGSYSVA